MKKKTKILLVFVILLASILAIVDYSRVSKGLSPVATFEAYNGNIESDYYYIGLFYYFGREISNSPTETFEGSSRVKMGIWILPGITVYEAQQ